MATPEEATALLNGIVNSVNHFGGMATELQASYFQLADRLTNLEAGGGERRGGDRRGLVDSRHLVPDVFTGDRTSTSWRDWSYRLKAFAQSRFPALRRAMELAERHAQVITPDVVEQFGIEEADDNDLRTLLASKTKDGAHVIVRQNDWAPGLEQYRSMARHHEPDTEARDLDDLRMILQPGAAATMADFAGMLNAVRLFIV